MYVVTETRNGKRSISYDVETKEKAIAFTNQMLYEYMDRYGNLDGDLDAVGEYGMADEETMSAYANLPEMHWVANIKPAA